MFHPYTQLNAVAQTLYPCIWDINASNPGLVTSCFEVYIRGLVQPFQVNCRITTYYIFTPSFPTKIHNLFLFHVCTTILDSAIPTSDERTRYAAHLLAIMSIPVYSTYCLQHSTSKAQNVTSHE